MKKLNIKWSYGTIHNFRMAIEYWYPRLLNPKRFHTNIKTGVLEPGYIPIYKWLWWHIWFS